MTQPEERPKPETEEITLEEWIASTQSCCGVEPESCRKPVSSATDDDTPPIAPSEVKSE